MSRSIRHGSSWPPPTGVPTSRALYDLRYPAAETARAASQHRRPQPHRIRTRTENPCTHGRCFDFNLLNTAYATAQRSIRAAERAQLGELRKTIRANETEADIDFGERGNGRRAAW